MLVLKACNTDANSEVVVGVLPPSFSKLRTVSPREGRILKNRSLILLSTCLSYSLRAIDVSLTYEAEAFKCLGAILESNFLFFLKGIFQHVVR